MDSKTDFLKVVLAMTEQEKLANLLTFEKVKTHLDAHIELSQNGNYRREREKFRLLIAKSKISEWMEESKCEIQRQCSDHSS